MKKIIKRTVVDARKKRAMPTKLQQRSYNKGLEDQIARNDAERSADIDAYYYGLNKESIMNEESTPESRHAEFDAFTRKHYGLSAQEVRGLPQNERIKIATHHLRTSWGGGDKPVKRDEPAKATKPSVGGGMDYYPKAMPGRRYMGDSVEIGGPILSETSREKTQKYLNRAMGDFSHQDMGTRGGHPEDRPEFARKKELRRKGITRAVNKLNKEEVNLDEAFKKGDFVKDPMGNIHRVFDVNGTILHTGEYRGNNTYGGNSILHTSKARKVDKPADVNEDVQIDEISRGALDSYRDKARMDQNDTLGIALRKYSSPEERAKYKAIADKRGRGMTTAAAKLSPNGTLLYSDRTVAKQAKVTAKEEVETVTELSKDTLRRYRMKAIYDRKEAEDIGKDARQEKREKGIKTAVDKLMTKESWETDYERGQLKLRNQGRVRHMIDYTAKKHFDGDRQEAAKFAHSHVGKLHHEWDEQYFDHYDHGDGIPVHIHDRDRNEHIDHLVKAYKGMQDAAKPATHRPFASLKKESVDESRMTKEYQKDRPGILPPLRRGAGDKRVDILMDKLKGIKRRYQKGDHFKSPLPESKED